MSWRTVVITGNAKLDYKMDYMVVRKSDMTTRIYIGEIGMLIIESTAISLTTMLLSELTKHKIKIVFCDEKHNPQSELIPYYGSHDTSAKVRMQTQWSKEVKENSILTIRGKGKYDIVEIVGLSKKQKIIVKIAKWV